MSTLNITSKEDPSSITIEISGSINEVFLHKSLQIPANKNVIIDFSKVTGINSLGIRHWIQWVRTYPKSKYIFRSCPHCVVDQMNSVIGFIPEQCTVESFYVPYYSEESGEEVQVLYKLNQDYFENKGVVPKEVKDSAGKKMELDIYPQKYFKFLSLKKGG